MTKSNASTFRAYAREHLQMLVRTMPRTANDLSTPAAPVARPADPPVLRVSLGARLVAAGGR